MRYILVTNIRTENQTNTGYNYDKKIWEKTILTAIQEGTRKFDQIKFFTNLEWWLCSISIEVSSN